MWNRTVRRGGTVAHWPDGAVAIANISAHCQIPKALPAGTPRWVLPAVSSLEACTTPTLRGQRVSSARLRGRASYNP